MKILNRPFNVFILNTLLRTWRHVDYSDALKLIEKMVVNKKFKNAYQKKKKILK